MQTADLFREISKREAKNSQVKIGDLREIFAHFADMIYEDSQYLGAFLRYADRRKAKKASVKSKSK